MAATPPTASGHWETASFQMWVAQNVILFVAGDANVYKKAAGWSRFTNILGINSEIEIPGNYYLYTMKVNVTSVSPRAASIKIGRRFAEGVPAILDTISLSSPRILLIREDLPTLGLPIMATLMVSCMTTIPSVVFGIRFFF